MPKATAVFDADDSRLTGALASINGKMLALQSRIAKFAAAFIADHHAPVRPASRLDRAEFTGTSQCAGRATSPAARRILDCHGDLRCEHVHFSGGEINIFDCIEFNERFRFIDVANDVAFLAMDLDFWKRRDLAK